MKLTKMEARAQDGHAELIVELDGVHYEAERIRLGDDAVDVARRLHTLAERILRRCAARTPDAP